MKKSPRHDTSSNVRKLALFAALAATGLIACSLRAQTVWSGAASPDMNWSTGGNWSTTVAPGGGDSVVFGATGTAAVAGTINNIVDTSFTINTLSFTNASLFHRTQISAGNTLTDNGDFLVGGATESSAVAATTSVSFTNGPGGDGTLILNGNSFTVSDYATNSSTSLATLDLSGLSYFIYGANNGTWTIASGGSNNRYGGLVILAGVSNNVTATTINFYSSNSSNGGNGSTGIRFGAGTNVINVGTFNIVRGKNSATVSFATTNGGLRLRGATGNSDDSSRANVIIASRNSTGTGTTSGTLNLSGGHPVDVKIGTLVMGEDSQSGGNAASGTLSFDNGVVDVNAIFMAISSNAAVSSVTATINVGTNATLIVGAGGMSMANFAAGTNVALGTLNITGGTVIASNNIAKASAAAGGTNIINVSTGRVTLVTSATVGTATIPVNRFNTTNGNYDLPAVGAAARIFVSALGVGGSSNNFNVATVPSVFGYPVSFPLVKYTSLAGTPNFTVASLPSTFKGYISNNTVNSSIDLVLTNGPLSGTNRWQGYAGGTPDSSWDTTTQNWLTLGGALTTYLDGNVALFDNSASNNLVSLNQDVAPGVIQVTNTSLTYTFVGGGKITGSGNLVKQGSGTLILDNSGANDFTGGITVSAGTLQVGNNDSGGNLPPASSIQNNSALVFMRTDTVTVSNAISGSGSITNPAGGTLKLAGVNTFTGNVWVTNNSTLQLGSSNALPTGTITTIANGSTLDLNGFPGGGSVITKGAGNGNGAVNNAGGAINGFLGLTNLTLTGDTTLGTQINRWDLRSTGGTTGTNLAVLSTGGQPYSITKIGTGGTGTVPGFLGFVSVAVDTNLADINVQQGTFEVEGNTTGLGNPTNKLTIEAGAAFMTYSATNQFNKVIVLKDGGTIQNGNGNNTIIGPLTLTNVNSSANCYFNVGGTSLTLSNVITGDGTLNKSTGTNILNINGNSPNFAGGIYLGAGTLVLNGTLNNALGVTENLGKFVVNGNLQGAGVSVGFISSLAGSGVIDGAVTANGMVSPGDSNTVATLTMGGLTFQGGAWFDLNIKNGVGGGTNDLIVVNGDLTMNGGNLYINPLTILQTGVSYRLFNYTGNLNWNTDPNIPSVNGYTFTLDHSTQGQVNLTASGGPSVWNGGSTTSSYWTDAANWGGTAITVGGGLNFGGTTRLNNTNDFADGTSFGDMTFIPGAGSFVLNGGSIVLAGDIVNFSTNTETISLGLSYGNNRIIDGESGRLVINNGLTNTANLTTLTLNGTGTLVDILGADAAAKTNSLVMNASNANWTLLDNQGSAPISAPWAFLINAGTFNFGTATSAPNFTNTTVNGLPQDNTLGNVAGATATLNMSNGTFTTTARFNTATALNCTSIVNQVGGVWNVGNQFQGANGGNAGELSILNLTGGTMNIGTAANPGSVFYLASRGNGILNISGSATFNSGVFDVARNAGGNTIACTGVVNLNGGTLAVSRVGTATANSQTGVSFLPSATVNFNGGILKARGSSSTFFQGSIVAPVIPIAAVVKSGGALIDSDTNAITFLEPLIHDSSLGATPDGGLVKLGAGTLTLTATNTYTGLTIISNGTLAVNGTVPTAVTVSSNATLAGSGIVSNNVSVGAYGTLSPASLATVGNLTIVGNVTLAANSTNVMTLAKGSSTNDLVLATAAVPTTITYNGTLVLTNISGSLASTDTFKLFSASNYSGTFTAVLPAVPAPGLGWDTSTLGTDGTLRFVTTVNLTPTNVTAVVSGNQLTLSWPFDHTGWHLQAQTNSLSTGLGTNWVTIPNTDQSNQYTTTLDPTQGAVFYRMVYP